MKTSLTKIKLFLKLWNGFNILEIFCIQKVSNLKSIEVIY